MDWYLAVWKKYAVFDGRARRTEYWTFALVNFVIGLLAYIPIPFLLIPLLVYDIAALIPGLAVAVRRLHDTGRSGWWLLIGLVPLAGAIILLVFYLTDSQPGSNQYGPNPKYALNAADAYQTAAGFQPTSAASYCRNCGTQAPAGAAFCQKCGARTS